MHQLTTTYLAAYAAQQLAGLCEAASRDHDAAKLMPGSTQAHACSKRIDSRRDSAYGLQVLGDICYSVGDPTAARQIYEQIDAAAVAMIRQSLEARHASAPREAA
jgi:hypothetical protein